MDIELSLVVLRVADLERSRLFYEALGLRFVTEKHGDGPEHLAAECGRAVLELYPRGDGPSSAGTRLGFRVGGERRVVADPDGHKVELT